MRFHGRNIIILRLIWIKEVYRTLKSSGNMYVFSGWNNLKDILLAIDELGFITVNHMEISVRGSYKKKVCYFTLSLPLCL